MTLGALALIAGFIVAVALAGDVLARLPLTPPMLAVSLGLAISAADNQHVSITLGSEEVLLIAEVTLIVLLFSDASRISLPSLRETGSLPFRLLLIGLPLAAAAGIVATGTILSSLTWAEAALVAAILTPTDAAVGQAVVSSPAVPGRIRHALDVESGLNDGLIVPVIGLMIALVVGAELESSGSIAAEALSEIGLGALVGVVGGYGFGRLGRWMLDTGKTGPSRLRLATLAALASTVGLAIAVGGNGFIAAFVAGIALRTATGELCDTWLSLPENVGQLGAIVAFVMFGATMVEPALGALTWPIVATAAVLLTVARMVPVTIALLGSDLRPPTVAFIGWFGPRGLASMLFALALTHEEGLDGSEQLITVITITVLASIFLHGMTAVPLARRYGAWLESHPATSELCENFDAPAQRPRASLMSES